MNNVINILENIANNAALTTATPDELQQLLHTEISDTKVLAALQQQNVYELEIALKARTGLVCGIMPAEEPQKQPDEEPKKQPSEEPKPTKKSHENSVRNDKIPTEEQSNTNEPILANVG
ncbi:hypothetical protein [Rheinheimera sp. MMS21-TC3]|uniref:hypothetical protein n=1 Tax=Rheinheimera sp. MMS21-TC3 TaxID=3072790 RepID=UPI0028C3DA17|nr:hypothetical protein [Rheinheimera sp. MMS21-TC3]WNO60938.1 hypothetical protein RDV63_08250 [Rheinheimera sp. MMS21-TC3]